MTENDRIDDELLENVSGGTGGAGGIGNSAQDEQETEIHKLTWCHHCKTQVPYKEFSGGRCVCRFCGNFVDV